MQRHKVKEWSSGQQGKGVRFQPLCVIYTFFGRLTSLTHNLLSVHQSDAGESSLVFAQQVWLCSQGKGLVSFLKRIVIKHVEWFVNSKSEIWNQWCWIIRSQFLWDKQHRTNLVWWAKKEGIVFGPSGSILNCHSRESCKVVVMKVFLVSPCHFFFRGRMISRFGGKLGARIAWWGKRRKFYLSLGSIVNCHSRVSRSRVFRKLDK